MRSIAAPLAILAFVAGPVLRTQAAPSIEMVVGCQQNLSDGRILVSDGRLLPPNARYVIKRYTPKTQDGGWSFGECVLTVTQGVSGQMPAARLAGPGDLAFVRDTTHAAYAPYLPVLGAMPLPVEADHAGLIAAGQVWLVRDGGVDAGLMVLEPAADHLTIESLAVLPACQGRGLGQWMLGFAEARAREAGLPELRLYTNALMARNIGIYRQAGFVETGRRPVAHRPGFVRVYMARPVAGAPAPP